MRRISKITLVVIAALLLLGPSVLPVAAHERQGCTPGFWKNNTGAWGATGYSPDQLLTSVFSNVPMELQGDTLLQALNYGGGPGTLGGSKILLRAAVAALLNAAHPNIESLYQVSHVVNMTNDALYWLNRDYMINKAYEWDVWNNQGCPLCADEAFQSN